MTTPSVPSDAPDSAFKYPPIFEFKPFFTQQPTSSTLSSQLQSWRKLLLSYTAHHRLFVLALSDLSPSSPLFHNPRLKRHCSSAFISTIVSHLLNTGDLETEATIVPSKDRVRDRRKDGVLEGPVCVWWKSANEWASLLEGWIEKTGQRGSVFTLYELREGDAVSEQEWHGMPGTMFDRVVDVIVRRGKGALFGVEGAEGGGRGIKVFA